MAPSHRVRPSASPRPVRSSRRSDIKKNVVETRPLVLHEVGCQIGREKHTAAHAQTGTGLPVLNGWRNNLTALSQEHNLYFLASGALILVYELDFPSHLLSTFPSLELPLPITCPGLPGNFRNADPHSVNNMITSKLGDREILVCACDDGDVMAFWMGAIVDAVELAEMEGTKPHFNGNIRPLLHENVGASAWGLATHELGRMIAVSANSWEITIFCFALHQNSKDIDSDEELEHGDEHQFTRGGSLGWTQYYPGSKQLEERRENIRLTINYHQANVPAISFCNTPDDTKGQFLLSTDIAGNFIYFDLFQKEMRASLIPDGDLIENFVWGALPRSGWGVFFFDPRCFDRNRSSHSSIAASSYTGAISDVYDVSFLKDNVPDTGTWTTAAPGLLNRFASVTAPQNSGQQPQAVNMNQDDSDDGDMAEQDDDSSVEDEDSEVSNTESGNDVESRRAADPNYFSRTPFCDYKILHFGNRSRTGILSSPIMFVQPKHITLFQSGAPHNLDITAEGYISSPPAIHLGNPLEQEISDERFGNWLEHCDRMNLNAPIPELGVLILGSGKGRAAVVSLHEAPRLAWGASRKPTHIMHLDYILPFNSQENQDKRPRQVLVGLAAGPVPGSDRSRWRIMLMYRDHTLLTYEIYRTNTGRVETIIT